MRSPLRSAVVALALLATACEDAPPTISDVASASPGASRVGPIDGGSGECDPWLDPNWCEEDGGDCINSVGDPSSQGSTAQGCEDAGGGGGTGSTDRPPAPDTCKTDNSVLNDRAVQAGFKELWNQSGINEPQYLRAESAGWIIRNADGSHRVMPISYRERTPCNVNGDWNAPDGAVGFVHTHPFRAGEPMEICGALKDQLPDGRWVDMTGPDGRPVYQTYRNQPSVDDRQLLNDAINRIRKAQGKNVIDGYVIDNERITRYGWNDLKDVSYARCGY